MNLGDPNMEITNFRKIVATESYLLLGNVVAIMNNNNWSIAVTANLWPTL